MCAKKKIDQSINGQKSVESAAQTKNPLVFISHDTRDSELAEEFSNLLKSASAGALKSFRSSDKKGTQGIEYGQEWYPAIMDKIDEASDVVCLLTQNSVDRPWILYEAGVAKGKLDKKVIGIALGIPLSSAISGPFAQFQNNDGDVDSVTKLVLELVRKVPGLDPDQQLVRTLVDGFVNKASEIIEKGKKQSTKGQKKEVMDDSVAKLFEEVKIMFDSLTSRIETRIDPDNRRKRRMFHPMLLEEMMRFGIESNDKLLAFLFMISVYKDDFPWFYEIGLETYRSLRNSKSPIERRKVISSFEKALEMIGHPMMRDFYGKNEDMYFFHKQSKHFIMNFFGEILHENKSKE